MSIAIIRQYRQTGLEPRITEVILHKNRKGARYDISSPLRPKMVGGEVVGWNHLLPSLITLAEKLEELGLVYYDGSTSYVESEQNYV